MLLVSREAGELVANLDDAVLVGFEEEADVAVVDYGNALVFGGFLGRQLHVSIYPGLSPNVSIKRDMLVPVTYL